MTTARLAAIAGAAAAAITTTTFAQCTPTWDTTIGIPGATGGYVAPMVPWNDGSGTLLYVGGSFSSAGGVFGTSRIARLNPDTSTWSALATGVDGFVTSIRPFNTPAGPRLIVGGGFQNAGTTPGTAAIAAWNGSAWESLNTGIVPFTGSSVWALTEFNGQLIVGGGFANMGAATSAGGIAAWNGTTFSNLGTGIAGAFSPVIFTLAVFDEDASGPNPPALFAAGRFDSVGGAPGTARIARWNGSSWSSVGGGLAMSTTVGPEAMVVFDDGTGPALYVAGANMAAAGMPTTNVARWNGSTWTAVGPSLGTGRLTSMTVWDDGSGPTLFIGGTGMPGINYLAKLNAGTWQTYLNGIQPTTSAPFPSVFGLAVYENRLYVGGNFTNVNGSALIPANGIARITGCAAPCYANCDASTGTPALTPADFVCFLNKFRAGDPYANCDASTGTPALTPADFVCFLNKFRAGC